VKSFKQFAARQALKFYPDFPEEFKAYLVEKLRWEKLGWFQGRVIINSYFPPIPSKAVNSVAKAWRSGMEGRFVPEVATVAVTNKCPYNCLYCSVPDKTVSDMPMDLLNSVIKQLQNMGSYHISLTGGEPLLRGDLEDIIAAVDDRSVVKLFTTGYSLTKARAKELKKAGLFSINISLDSSDRKIHDRGCGFAGAFDIALKAIENARKASLLTCVATVASRNSVLDGTMDTFLRFLKKQGVDEVSIFEPAPTGKLSFREDVVLSDVERKALHELHKKINERADERYPRVFSFPYVEGSSYMGCGAGCTRVHVTALGHVTPCDFTPISFGNIQQENIEVILDRMRGYFKQPGCGCFILNHFKELREMYDDQTGMADGDKLVEREKMVMECHLPAFYKLLMVTQDTKPARYKTNDILGGRVCQMRMK